MRSQLKSARSKRFAAILCMVLVEFATVPTLYVSNSFHQYMGAVMSMLTNICRTNLRWSVPDLHRRFARSRSFSPNTNVPSGSVWLSIFAQLFSGLRMPRVAFSKFITLKWSILITGAPFASLRTAACGRRHRAQRVPMLAHTAARIRRIFASEGRQCARRRSRIDPSVLSRGSMP